MITIKHASNGYIVSMDEDTFVFEERDENIKRHLQEMLYMILDLLGELGSKYDEERIRIVIDGKNDTNMTEENTMFKFYDTVLKLERDMLSEYNRTAVCPRGETGISGGTKIDIMIGRLQSCISFLNWHKQDAVRILEDIVEKGEAHNETL